MLFYPHITRCIKFSHSVRVLIINDLFLDKHKSKVIHILVSSNKPKSIRALAPFLNINEQRSSDKCTPLHIAAWTKNPELISLLVELGGDMSIENKYGECVEELIKVRAHRDNIVFLDLEMTGLPSTNPHILEVAVVITVR